MKFIILLILYVSVFYIGDKTSVQNITDRPFFNKMKIYTCYDIIYNRLQGNNIPPRKLKIKKEFKVFLSDQQQIINDNIWFKFEFGGAINEEIIVKDKGTQIFVNTEKYDFFLSGNDSVIRLMSISRDNDTNVCILFNFNDSINTKRYIKYMNYAIFNYVSYDGLLVSNNDSMYLYSFEFDNTNYGLVGGNLPGLHSMVISKTKGIVGFKYHNHVDYEAILTKCKD